MTEIMKLYSFGISYTLTALGVAGFILWMVYNDSKRKKKEVKIWFNEVKKD